MGAPWRQSLDVLGPVGAWGDQSVLVARREPCCHQLGTRIGLAMGFLDNVAIAGFAGLAALVAKGIHSAFADARENERRRNTPPSFDARLDAHEFARIAKEAARKAPRIADVRVLGMSVHLTVRSNSGLSTWTAGIDFNDYGLLTGKYWISSENDQSPIPEFVAKAIRDQIHARVGTRGT